MRKLATIREVKEIRPIPGADSIELAIIDGWQCVVKKGELMAGSLCCYFEIDSLLPSYNPSFEFLAKGNKEKVMNIDGKEYRGYRLKTIRLRGELSQGLALPVDSLMEEVPPVGTDVSEFLEIVKYEAPIPACLSGQVRGNFPSEIPKTDEERIQNCPNILKDFAGDMFYVTEKLDGSSMTVYKRNVESPEGLPKVGEFHVCSRNLDLIETEGNTLWKVARELKLEEKTPLEVAIQGELVGEGIQGNPLKLKGQHFFAFSVYLIGAGRFMDYEEMKEFLWEKDIPMVPIVADSYQIGTEGDTMKDLLEWADGESMISETSLREGLVFRPKKESKYRVPRGMSRLSFKVISNSYLEKVEQ